MKNAIEAVVRAALRFWRTGEAEPHWKEEEWDVCPISTAREDGLRIAVLGPIDGANRSRADLVVCPQRFAPALQVEGDLADGEPSIERIPGKIKGVLVKFAHSRLIWPGPRQTEAWAKGQVALYFLQREWVRSQETEGWVWEECLAPLIRSLRGGKQALEDGSIGFETLKSVVANYVNPLRGGGFKAYVRAIIRRTQTVAWKRKTAEIGHAMEEGRSTLNHQRFRAFVRQRRRRGQDGVVVRKGRIAATTEMWTKLSEEWVSQAKRRDLGRALVLLMVQNGAKLGSAQRQVRRWFEKTNSAKAVFEKAKAWRPRK